jgi:4-hydroxy-2-oxoheptanedioate aldolase
LLGVKEEDKYALANVEQNLKIPALAFAEWGPGDMALSLGIKGGSTDDPKMLAARAKVFAAVKANHMFFLNTCSAGNVGDMIREGVMICSANAAAAEAGRKVSNRPTPY